MTLESEIGSRFNGRTHIIPHDTSDTAGDARGSERVGSRIMNLKGFVGESPEQLPSGLKNPAWRHR